MFLVVAMVTLAVSATAQASRASSLTVYSEPGHKGDSKTFNSSSPDLGDWTGKARSVCGTGFWVLFSETDYDVYSYRLWLLGMPNCLDLSGYNLDKNLACIRQVGVPDDIAGKSLSLFAEEFFGGDMTYLSEDTPSIPNGGDFSSAVVSGKEPWSIFSEENYGGDTACLNVHTEYGPVYGWFQDPSEMGDVGGSVRSARKGCPSSSVPMMGQSGPGGAARN